MDFTTLLNNFFLVSDICHFEVFDNKYFLIYNFVANNRFSTCLILFSSNFISLRLICTQRMLLHLKFNHLSTYCPKLQWAYTKNTYLVRVHTQIVRTHLLACMKLKFRNCLCFTSYFSKLAIWVSINEITFHWRHPTRSERKNRMGQSNCGIIKYPRSNIPSIDSR